MDICLSLREESTLLLRQSSGSEMHAGMYLTPYDWMFAGIEILLTFVWACLYGKMPYMCCAHMYVLQHSG